MPTPETSCPAAARLCEEVKENLTQCILPYWIEKMQDPNGGFYGRRDGYDHLDENAPRGAILNARILWTFAAAYRQLGNPEYLKMATRAKRELIDHFYDADYGGIYWSVDAVGNPVDTKKQYYALGFAIYGLAEYVRATGDEEAMKYARRLFHDIESHSRDPKGEGYLEASTREWQPIADMRLSDKDENAAKTMNTHLHIIEGYTNLLRVWRDEELLDATRKLLEIFLDRIESQEMHGHLGLFFNSDWQRQDRIISYGHDIEASWLLLETAQVIGDKELIERTLRHTRRIADAALEGRCVDGSMVYERHANGSYDNEKHWWVQAENVVGQLYQYKYHSRPEMLEKAVQTWNYIKDKLVDHENGEWYWSILPDGSVNRKDDKAGFWKCPYHNSRMCLETLSVLGS